MCITETLFAQKLIIGISAGSPHPAMSNVKLRRTERKNETGTELPQTTKPDSKSDAGPAVSFSNDQPLNKSNHLAIVCGPL